MFVVNTTVQYPEPLITVSVRYFSCSFTWKIVFFYYSIQMKYYEILFKRLSHRLAKVFVPRILYSGYKLSTDKGLRNCILLSSPTGTIHGLPRFNHQRLDDYRILFRIRYLRKISSHDPTSQLTVSRDAEKRVWKPDSRRFSLADEPSAAGRDWRAKNLSNRLPLIIERYRS